ncbi:hypothetical protein GCM10010353_65910 [Streptomyces chryseus]|nr:hypothetical protein GCM10010353_65910 [Streptomyces chryseus]
MAGSDLWARQIEVGEVGQAEEGPNDRGGVPAPARAPHGSEEAAGQEGGEGASVVWVEPDGDGVVGVSGL